MGRILIGSGNTDLDGLVTGKYTGSSKGVVQFVAYNKERTLSSEIYEVFDVIQYVDKSSDWYTQSGTVTQNTNGEWVIDGYHFIYNPSIPNSQYGWSGNLTLEFEVVNNTSGAVQFYNTSANFTQRLTVFGATTGSKVKLVFDGSKVTPIVDGQTKTSYDFNPTGLFRIGFINSFTLKNILIY